MRQFNYLHMKSQFKMAIRVIGLNVLASSSMTFKNELINVLLAASKQVISRLLNRFPNGLRDRVCNLKNENRTCKIRVWSAC